MEDGVIVELQAIGDNGFLGLGRVLRALFLGLIVDILGFFHGQLD